ncbi:uncharacterized protein LOC134280990 [Saccostrea cucullata]|uniref:uncharacterized protein LOC134267304 n=1 Tax=Saccostrea cuccullata TaxID=36930 RepID=UPI002ED46589
MLDNPLKDKEINITDQCAEIEREIKKRLFGQKTNSDITDRGENFASEEAQIFKHKPLKEPLQDLREKLEMHKFDNPWTDGVEKEMKTYKKIRATDRAINKKTKSSVKKAIKKETKDDFRILRESPEKDKRERQSKVHYEEDIQKDLQTIQTKVSEENQETPNLQPLATTNDERKWMAMNTKLESYNLVHFLLSAI